MGLLDSSKRNMEKPSKSLINRKHDRHIGNRSNHWMEAAVLTTMENLKQIHQTLSDVDGRVPDAIRVALGLGHRVSPAPAPGEDDDVADFAASLLQPLATTEDGGDHGPADPDVPASALRIEWGSCYVPLHDHDAHFGDAKAGAFGVADGVGEYMDAGVDAGAFSRGLMASASAEVAGWEPGTPVCPHALLERAYEKTAASGAPGASTAVILSLAAGNALAWAYIGDSAFAVLRGSKIVSLSTPQRHLSRTSRSKLHFASTPARRKEHLFSFNDPPFQLSAVGARSDSVADAMVGQFAVRAGDVVVAGTDGLFDNVLDEQLERAVQMGTKLGFSPKNMADIIAGVAYERSNESSSRKLRKGKPDDITVLVAFIVS